MKKNLVFILLVVIFSPSYSFANEPIECNTEEANKLIIKTYNYTFNEALNQTYDIDHINKSMDELISNKKYNMVLAVMPIYMLSHLKVTVMENKEIDAKENNHSRVCLAELRAKYDESIWKGYIDQIPKDIFKTDPDKTITNIANNVWIISRIKYTIEVTKDQKNIVKSFDFLGDPFSVQDSANESPSLLHLLKD